MKLCNFKLIIDYKNTNQMVKWHVYEEWGISYWQRDGAPLDQIWDLHCFRLTRKYKDGYLKWLNHPANEEARSFIDFMKFNS